MEFLDDTNLAQKKESSTIALARELGVLSKSKEKRSSTSKNSLELIDKEPRKTESNKNGYLVTSEDIDKYLNQEKSNKDSQNTPNNTINSKNYIINNISKSSAFIPFEFKGEAKEYFKIWIVNIVLTILTLGIYSAWAKVRNNRYIYSNTYLNGSSFEFNAKPKRILYGRLIVVGFYALFYIFSNILYNKEVALTIFIIFLLLLPWLIRQAISFRLKSASYRNIHFRYYAKAKNFYGLTFLGISLFIGIFIPLLLNKYLHFNKNIVALSTFVLIILFIAIAMPILYLKFKKLIINYSAYGSSMFKFSATKSDTIKIFFKIAIVTTLLSIVLTLVSMIITGAFSSIFNVANIDWKSSIGNIIIYLLFASFYIFSLSLYKGVTDGYLSNFTREHTTIKDAEFKTTISPLKLGIISATNGILTLLSLGLLYPWAKMRYTRYKTVNTHFKCKDYSSFTTASRDKESTIGEEALDFLDIDIGI